MSDKKFLMKYKLHKELLFTDDKQFCPNTY